LNDQIKDGEVGRACEMYVGEDMCLQGLVATWRKETTWKTWA